MRSRDAAGGRGNGRPASQRDVRDQNLALVLAAVADGGPSTRARVAQQTGLTKATVSSLVEQLAAAGLLRDQGPAATGALGRPGSVVTLAADGPVGLGMEVQVDYTAACVVDLTGAVRGLEVRPLDARGRAPAEVLDRAARLARRTLAAVDGAGPLLGVEVALPGPVQRATGVLVGAPNLGWGQLPVAEQLAAALAVPPAIVTADNEANLAALGEAWAGAARGVPDFVQVVGEIGVGGGLVLGGEVFRGGHGFAGEIGHVPVTSGGEVCACGARGCLETVAGLRALLAAAGIEAEVGTRMGTPTGATATLVAAAAAGDEGAVQAIRRAGTALGRAIGGACNVVDVDTVVLGGIYAALADGIAPALRAELDARRLTAHLHPSQVLVSQLGEQASVRGAALSVVRGVLADPGPYLRARRAGV